jgi:hypothetical protein
MEDAAMLAPDDLRLRATLGDETVATTPDDDQPDFEKPDGPPPFNAVKGHRIADVIEVPSLAADAVQTFRLPYQPDAVYVSVPNVATVEVEVSQASSDLAYPDARLGPGGYCRIPGRGTLLTIKSSGAAAVQPVVRTFSGFGQMQTGDVLIVYGAAS